MCGIAGLWKPAGLADSDPASLETMLRSIRHRGPDGYGTEIDPERGLAMGHARLKIIDLHTGDQPLIHDRAEGRQVLTANGEFYDYKPIRAHLACLGERFQSKSDSEIALPLYRRHGLDFVQQLRGEFAFALYDAARERLVLVRDRFGIKPLYFHVSEGGLYWASELKALAAHPEVPRRVDRRAALHQLMQVMAPGLTTLEGVEALLPGHMLVVERRGDRLEARRERWWDVDFPKSGEHLDPGDADGAVQAVREGLCDAVRTRLEADVPVGCYLSGGIDSCSILGMATAMQQSPVKAFTISFDHDAYDESDIAREMAESVSADQDVLRLSATDLYGESYVRTLWHAERTFYNTLGVAKWHMSRHVRDAGFRVVVTGEGSDELFGGYPAFKRDHLLHGGSEGAAALRRMEESNQLFRGAILAEQSASHPDFEELCGFTPSWIQPWLLTLEVVRPLLSKSAAEELADYDPVAAIAGTIDPAAVRDREPLDRAQYTWIKTMLEGQILTWGGDRVDMAHSMESRPAFLDHHVAELACRIHPDLRVRDGIEKWVLREAMRGVLPRVLYEREKFAFMAPPAHTDVEKRQAVESLAAVHLTPERIEAAGLVDPERVAAFLAGLDDVEAEAATRSDIILNHLLGLHVLHAQLVEGEAPDPD